MVRLGKQQKGFNKTSKDNGSAGVGERFVDKALAMQQANLKRKMVLQARREMKVSKNLFDEPRVLWHIPPGKIPFRKAICKMEFY